MLIDRSMIGAMSTSCRAVSTFRGAVFTPAISVLQPVGLHMGILQVGFSHTAPAPVYTITHGG